MAASGAGAAAGVGAELLDVLLTRFVPAPLEAVAAMTLVGALGAVSGVGLAALRFRARPPSGRGLVASALAGALALASTGLIFLLGSELDTRFLGVLTIAAAVVPPLLFVLVFAALRQLLPRRFEPAPFRAGAGLWACTVGMLALGASRPLLSGHTGALLLGGVALLGLGIWLVRKAPGHAALDGALVLLLGLLLTWPAPSPDAAPARHAAPRSIVFVVLDTTRADALGAYGAPDGQTPVLDRLADEGAIFDDMVSPSPWTAPSHASMFTGLYPRTHGVHNGGTNRLDERFETTAERLGAAGYQTAAISSNSWLRVTRSVRGFEHFEEVNHLHRDKLILARLMRYSGIGWEQWIDRGAAEAETAIGDWLAQLDPERPYFLFLNLFEAHNPYLPPLRDRPAGPGAWLRGIRAMRSYHPVAWHTYEPREPWRIDATRDLYAAGIRYQDRRVGRILDVIRERVDLDRALLLVTSDHGDNLGDGHRWGHNLSLNEALIRVPFLLRAPGVFEPGGRIPETHQTIDVHATLLDWAGLDPPSGTPSRSLLPGRRQGRGVAFAEVYPELSMLTRADPRGGITARELDTPIWAVRADGEKLVVRRGAEQLFDVRADPAETRDLAAEEPERAAALRAELDRWLGAHPGPGPDSCQAPAPRSDPEALDPETRRQLEALGYL